MEILLSKWDYFAIQDKKGRTPLTIAVENSDINLVQLLASSEARTKKAEKERNKSQYLGCLMVWIVVGIGALITHSLGTNPHELLVFWGILDQGRRYYSGSRVGVICLAVYFAVGCIAIAILFAILFVINEKLAYKIFGVSDEKK